MERVTLTKPILIFRGSSGINTKVDPARLRFNTESGISELAACVNCFIDDTGRVVRRDGVAATIRTEEWENLFSCESYGLGTKGDALCVIEPDMSYIPIRTIQVGARMAYVKTTDGTSDVIFYCNGYETGKIINKVSCAWTLIRPTEVTTRKELYQAPVGHLLEIYNSRMLIAQDNIIWYSEPNTYHSYRLGVNYFVFPSRISMIVAVTKGLWISDEESIYFLEGDIAPETQKMPLQVKKADYAVIEGTVIKVPASRIGLDGLSSIVVVFTTNEGICVGSDSGQLINLTERKIDIPSGLSGSGFYKDGHYVVTIT